MLPLRLGPDRAARAGVLAVAAMLGVAACATRVPVSSRRSGGPVTAERPVPLPPVDEETIEGPPAPEIEGPPIPSAEEARAGREAAAATAATIASDPVGRALLAAIERTGVEVAPSLRGLVITIPDAAFEYGGDELEEDDRRRLHAIGSALHERAPDRRVSVEGHTDSTGAALYNEGLSRRRADAVAKALVEAGVDARKVDSAGYGARYPIAPNERSDGSDNPEGRARNRRVEIVVAKPGTGGQH